MVNHKCLVYCFVFLFGTLVSITAHKETKTDTINNNTSKENCIVRDGRDGVPGPPGLNGQPGVAGRDGRDCFTTLSLTRVFDLEKRLGELHVKYQFIELQANKLTVDVAAYRYQTQRLLRVLGAKGIIDSDVLEEASQLDKLQTTTEAVPSTASEEVPTASEEVPTLTTSNLKRGDSPKHESKEHTTTKKIPRDQATVGRKGVGKNGKFYTATRKIRLPTAEPIPSVDVNPITKNGKVCPKRFNLHQELPTQGAVNMDVFVIGNHTYLAVANFHLFNSKDGYNTDSFVYRMNPETDLFEIFQKIPTSGCRALVSFTSGGDQYLVAANHYDGVTYSLPSVIYKWNGTRFQDFRRVQTLGASSVQFFTLAGESFLVFANYRIKSGVSVSSVIYQWKNDSLEIFQEIKTHGAVDGTFFQSQTGDGFLVFANYYTPQNEYNVESEIFKWNGQMFEYLQGIQTSAAMGVDMFEEAGIVFLALASHRTMNSWHSNSVVFQWNGTSFELFQEIPTTAAVKVHHFYDALGSLYLTIANYFDEITEYEAHSVVYKFRANHLEKFQGILTTGAYDLQPFTHKGVSYLASAFRFDGKNSALKSRIYTMNASCETDDVLLP